MSILRNSLVAWAPLALVMAAGCESSDSPDRATEGEAVDADFAQRADAVCAPYVDYDAAHLFAVEGFNRYAPDPDKLPRVAAFLDRNPTYDHLADDLAQLGDPATGGAAWTTVLADVSATTAWVRDQVHSARRSDAAAFADTRDELVASVSTLHADLRRLGLPAGSRCLEIEQDPLRTSGGTE